MQPKLTNKIFAFKRKAYLNNFLEKVKNEQKIDPKAFWQFREFYSSGFFDFNKTNIEISSILQFYNLVNDKNDILTFNSQYLKSIESIVNSLNFFDKKNLDCQNIIFENKNSLICENKDKNINILFLKSIDEMKQVNGLFDYLGKEQKLLKDKYWLSQTTIYLN
ncbi:hypothetical protein GYA19_02490 [Candidatus Beckwithbacteria bacterium]|nr:hypothetical protein [Candidatus Beckwithbacteria bacterium]